MYTTYIIATEISGHKSYVSALSHRAWDNRKIPMHSSYQGNARHFMNEPFAQKNIELLVNPTNRQYTIEPLEVNDDATIPVTNHHIE